MGGQGAARGSALAPAYGDMAEMPTVTMPEEVVHTGYPPSPGGVGGMLLGGGLSALGGLASTWLNIREGRKNRAWQERMANTAYQRQVADMRRAGLNPVLAAMKGGGADTPSGSVGQSGDLSGAGESVKATARLMALEKPLMEGQLANLRAQTTAAKAATEQTGMKTEMERKLMEANILVQTATAANVAANTARTIQDTKTEGGVGKFLGQYVPKSWVESIGELFGGGSGNGYGGSHSAKDVRR